MAKKKRGKKKRVKAVVQRAAPVSRKRARKTIKSTGPIRPAQKGNRFNRSGQQVGSSRPRRGNENVSRGKLNYKTSQRKRGAGPETPAFSSFFAPSKSERPQKVELGILVKKYWVGVLIGKKGVCIKQIRKRSNGANIDFGDDDILLGSCSEKWQHTPWPSFEEEKYTVCAISGTKQQTAEAAKLVAEAIGKSAQSPEYKIDFLVPEDYCGMFIGKKGANIKDMKGKGKDSVTMDLREGFISLGDSRVTLCTIFGPAENVLKCIDRTASWLGDISIQVLRDRETGRHMQQRLPQRLPPIALTNDFSSPVHQYSYPDERSPLGDRYTLNRGYEREFGREVYRNMPDGHRRVRSIAPGERGDLIFF